MLQCIPCAKLWSEKDSAHMFVDEIIWIFHSCIIETVSLYECECRIQVLRDLEIICILNKLRKFRQRLKLALLIKVTWPRIRSKLIWREISYRMRIWRNRITISRKNRKKLIMTTQSSILFKNQFNRNIANLNTVFIR